MRQGLRPDLNDYTFGPLDFFLGAKDIGVLLKRGQDSLISRENRRSFFRPRKATGGRDGVSFLGSRLDCGQRCRLERRDCGGRCRLERRGWGRTLPERKRRDQEQCDEDLEILQHVMRFGASPDERTINFRRVKSFCCGAFSLSAFENHHFAIGNNRESCSKRATRTSAHRA